MRILRYSFPLGHEPYDLLIPKGAKIVDCVWQERREMFSLYVEALPGMETERRSFVAVPTGFDLRMIGFVKHMRSIVMPDGFHVFHVYEVESRHSYGA